MSLGAIAARWLLAALLLPATALAAPAPDPQMAAVLARWDADPNPDLRGVIVLRGGKTIAERYYNGASPGELHDIRSAGKSITALLMGIAIDRRRIKGVEARVDASWPQARGTAIGDVRLDDVLTMRSGLAADDEVPDSPGNEDKLDEAADPLAFLLAIPRATTPGTSYVYNSATASIAGVVVAKATGMTMADFARKTLFTPLGITRWRWASDAAGYTKGQGNLWLTLRDFATIGEMVRQRGIHGRASVVSAGWLDAALAPRIAISAVDPFADHYGYFWYSKVHRIDGTPVPVSFASGNGGNKLYVIPSRQMVIAIQSRAYGRGYGQRRSQDILKAVLGADLKRRPPVSTAPASPSPP